MSSTISDFLSRSRIVLKEDISLASIDVLRRIKINSRYLMQNQCKNLTEDIIELKDLIRRIDEKIGGFDRKIAESHTASSSSSCCKHYLTHFSTVNNISAEIDKPRLASNEQSSMSVKNVSEGPSKYNFYPKPEENSMSTTSASRLQTLLSQQKVHIIFKAMLQTVRHQLY